MVCVCPFPFFTAPYEVASRAVDDIFAKIVGHKVFQEYMKMECASLLDEDFCLGQRSSQFRHLVLTRQHGTGKTTVATL